MKIEHTVKVENHIGTIYTKKYWTENAEHALNIAVSEAYPFGIKDATCRQVWRHESMASVASVFISIDVCFESTKIKLPVEKR